MAPPGVPARLSLRGIRKLYPGVVANDGIDLDVGPGEIHALLGENGAGKSTLVKIACGVTQPSDGQILWEGRPVVLRDPAHARSLGIGVVFQHFALFESLTVVENAALALPGRMRLDALARRIEELSARYGLPVDPRRLVHSMSVGERQRVEITRCLLQAPRLLIMDEPTSVLTPQAVRSLFATLRQLADPIGLPLTIAPQTEPGGPGEPGRVGVHEGPVDTVEGLGLNDTCHVGGRRTSIPENAHKKAVRKSGRYSLFHFPTDGLIPLT